MISRIGTLNIRTMYQFEEIAQVIGKYKITKVDNVALGTLIEML